MLVNYPTKYCNVQWLSLSWSRGWLQRKLFLNHFSWDFDIYSNIPSCEDLIRSSIFCLLQRTKVGTSNACGEQSDTCSPQYKGDLLWAVEALSLKVRAQMKNSTVTGWMKWQKFEAVCWKSVAVRTTSCLEIKKKKNKFISLPSFRWTKWNH